MSRSFKMRARSESLKRMRDMIKVMELKNAVSMTPEKLLQAEVLRSALDDIFTTTNLHGRKQRMEALNWVKSDEAYHIYCFISICDSCGFDAKTIRERIFQELMQ